MRALGKTNEDDQLWRLNNLYWIVNPMGERIKFKMNESQERLYREYHYLNLIPKARQLGFSTFIDILGLDFAVFDDNIAVGIIAHTREDAEKIFKTKVKYPYDNLHEDVRARCSSTQDSARALSFSNGSTVHVGTSLRSGTLNFLHISEFGKICSKMPEKADEIVSGSLNTVAVGNYIFIESTTEGAEGYFHDMVREAEHNQIKGISPSALEFKLHFFPWHDHKPYRLAGDIIIPDETVDYFTRLEQNEGIKLDQEQKNWYAMKRKQQGEFIYREHPATLDEAFMVSNEGYFYSKQMNQAQRDGRICKVPYDPSLTVDTFWDLGMDDATCIWFIQKYRQEYRMIDYYENSDEGLPHYIKVLQERNYLYGRHWFPHDIKVRELTTGTSRFETLKRMGVKPNITTKLPIEDGIEATRNVLTFCWFDEKKCGKGIKSLRNYKKVWNDKLASYGSTPLHNWASHGCFVAGTKIDSKNGTMLIEDISIGDFVRTPNGFKKVTNTFKYKSKNLMEIRSGKSKLVCTKNHKVFTPNGLVYADSLRYNDLLYSNSYKDRSLCKILYGSSCTTQNLGFRESFLSTKMKQKSSLMDTFTHGKGITTEEVLLPITMRPLYNGVCGNSIEGAYQANIISTILIGIVETILSRTFNVYQHRNTQKYTTQRKRKLSQESTFLRQWRRLKNGTSQMRVESGIGSTVERLGKKERKFLLSASGVSLISCLIGVVLSSVARIAKTSIDTIQKSISKTGIVPFATLSLSAENILLKKRVQEIVQLNPQDEVNVYDFAVEDDSCYYANGLLVSNSDAFRGFATERERIGHAGSMTQEKADDYYRRYGGRT